MDFPASQRAGGASRKRKATSAAGRGFKKRKMMRKRRGLYETLATPAKKSGLFSFNGEGPFPDQLQTTLLYRSIPINASGSAGTGTYTLQVVLNNLNDFDYSNVLGNKQPLYYDQLFSSTGPYQAYECKSWRTRITVINLASTAATVYWNGQGTSIGLSEEDTLTEVTNRSYHKQYHLAPKGGSGDRAWIATSGKMSKASSDVTYSAVAQNGSPIAFPVYGTLFINTPTTTDAPNVMIQVDHYFDVICFRSDGTSS